MTRRTHKDNRPRLLTPEELAEQLGVTVDHLSQLRDDNEGPAYISLSSRTIRYLSSEIAHRDRHASSHQPHLPPAAPKDTDDSTREV